MGYFKAHRATISIFLASLSIFGLPSIAIAQSQESIEAALRVNIAGRQRMLTQRMTGAACLVQNDIDSDLQQARLKDAVFLFEQGNTALRYGDQELGIGPETTPKIITALAPINAQWQEFEAIANHIVATGFAIPDQIDALDRTGLSILASANSAVGKIAVTYGELLEDLPLIYSISIDAAGRQRMLSQKAAKEMCLIYSGIDVDQNKLSLARTVDVFAASLNALVSGFPGMIVPAPTAEILAQLNMVEAAWQAPQATLVDAANGVALSAADISRVSAELETVLVLMNEAVGMY